MPNIGLHRSHLLRALACLVVAHGASAQSCPRQWVQLDLPVSPSPRFEGFFGGDQLSQRGTAGVLFGGVGPSGRLNDTWFWLPHATSRIPRWELVETNRTPPPMSNGGVATDATGVASAMQVFGGLVSTSTGLVPSAAWYTFDPFARTWQLRSATPSNTRWNNALAYGAGNLTTFGGAADLASTSPLLGSAVRVVDSVSPPPLGLPGVYAISGAQLDNASAIFPFGDRRATNSSAYVEVPGVPKLALENGVYSWQVLSWPMPPRCNYALASRRVQGASVFEVVLFGGDRGTFPSNTTLLGDTWVLDATTATFSQVQGPGPSPRRARNQLIYDRTRDWYVLFGGHNGDYLNETWVLSAAPVLRNQSRSQTHCAGQTLTLSVDIGWNDPMTYQWFENAQPISPSSNPSAATNTLIVPGFTAATPRVFSCIITAACLPQGLVSDDITITPAPADACLSCDSIDFNADTLFPDDQDLIDFLSVLAGGPCSTNTCSDIDFNNDGLFPDDNDLVAFLTVLAGGNC